jgi:hypothetical protein
MENIPSRESSDVKEIRRLIQLLKRGELKKRIRMEKHMPEDVLDVIEGTEGGGLAGDIYPLTKENHEAFIRLMYLLNMVMEDWLQGREDLWEYQILKRFKQKVISEYYLRSIKSNTLTKDLAELVTETIKEPTEVVRPTETKKEENK